MLVYVVAPDLHLVGSLWNDVEFITWVLEKQLYLEWSDLCGPNFQGYFLILLKCILNDSSVDSPEGCHHANIHRQPPVNRGHASTGWAQVWPISPCMSEKGGKEEGHRKERQLSSGNGTNLTEEVAFEMHIAAHAGFGLAEVAGIANTRHRRKSMENSHTFWVLWVAWVT